MTGPRHLLDVDEWSPEVIESVLAEASRTRDAGERHGNELLGCRVVLLFAEPSTRTRIAFEMAARGLSAETYVVDPASSSMVKGETLVDTALNLEAMSPDIIVMRHASSGACELLARVCRSRIINAGDGMHEHPTQALLDAFTIRQHKGRIRGLKVAIVGDLLHSRVLRSNLLLLSRLGADVWVCGPPTLVPPGIDRLGARVTTSGGTEPRWSADGRELFFRRGSEIHALTLEGSAVRSTTKLFDAGAAIRAYDVSRDGRFLLNLPGENHMPIAATIVSHWSAFAQTLRRDEK